MRAEHDLAGQIITIAYRENAKSRTLAEIQQAILELPESDYAQMSRWFHELDWKQWEAEIEQDSRDGKLDFLVAQAAQSQVGGTLQEL